VTDSALPPVDVLQVITADTKRQDLSRTLFLLYNGVVDYSFDENGNQTDRDADTFTFDHENRLTEAVISAVTSTSTYNGDGLRVSLTVDDGSPVTTDYLWDLGDALPNVLVDDTYTYVYGLDLISATDGSGNQSYYMHNGIGSVTNILSYGGSEQGDYYYDEFGVPTFTFENGIVNDRRFTGEQSDTNSSLYYLRARHYDPGTGRFLSQDPLGIGHPYTYVRNNPIGFADPSGLCDPYDLLCQANCYFPFSGSCKHAAEQAAQTVAQFTKTIGPYALECAIWGGSAAITTGFNPGATAAGCATGVVARLVSEFVSNPYVDCLVWAGGALSVTRIAAKAALSTMTASKTAVAGCVSGAGSWFLNKEGLSMASTECINWGVPAALAAKSWDRVLAAVGGCAGGSADVALPGD
jgi:RHS repeat-associated protein